MRPLSVQCAPIGLVRLCGDGLLWRSLCEQRFKPPPPPPPVCTNEACQFYDLLKNEALGAERERRQGRVGGAAQGILAGSVGLYKAVARLSNDRQRAVGDHAVRKQSSSSSGLARRS